MLRLAGLVAVACLVPSCFIIFDGDDKACPLAEPAIAPAPLRNPATLQCESFGGATCNDRCGPCPAVAHTPPIPSWGACGSACEGLTESACVADAGCRVVKDAFCALQGDCLTDYLGCFPTDTQTDTSIDCFTADAWQCSRNSSCTAMHSSVSCLDQACPMAFELCVPEGQHPGQCWEPVACRASPPACPSGSTPGVEGGCYTGACIPRDLCEPMP